MNIQIRKAVQLIILGAALAGNVSVQAADPILTSDGYTKSGTADNPFDKYGDAWYECTRYAWGRAFEKTGTIIKFSVNSNRNGGRWYDIVAGLPKGTTPRANSLVSWNGTTRDVQGYLIGHVAYIEEVNGDQVTISEANWNSDGKYNKMKTMSIKELQTHVRGGLAGYVYLTPPPPTLSSLSLYCPSSVNENTSNAGVCTTSAFYSNGTNKTVAPFSWTDDSSAISVNNGILSTTSVSSDTRVSIRAEYQEGGISKGATTSLIVKDIPAVVLPKISSVSPTSVTLNTPTKFTVNGTNLTDGLAFWIAECAGNGTTLYPLSGGTSTSRTFSCTPKYSKGVKDGVIKDKANGTTLYNFKVTVK